MIKEESWPPSKAIFRANIVLKLFYLFNNIYLYRLFGCSTLAVTVPIPNTLLLELNRTLPRDFGGGPDLKLDLHGQAGDLESPTLSVFERIF